MLSELVISNVAIIERQTVSFSPGLNVLSGETGAGKSIILDALELILGARASTNLIRTGCESLEVQAHFDLTHLPQKLRTELPAIAQGDELAITRSFNSQSKNKILINGHLGTVAMLSEIGKQLINICGQNQHVRLLDPKFHLELIDGYTAKEDLLDRYKVAFKIYLGRKSELEELKLKAQDREARLIWLEETLKELTQVELRAGIRKELEGRLKRFNSSQRGVEILNKITEQAEEIASLFSASSNAISELERIDPDSKDISALFETSRTYADEFVITLQKHASSFEMDDQEYEKLSDTITHISRLERKHRVDDAGLCELMANVKQELAMLPTESIDKLAKEVEFLFSEVIKLAKEISKTRKKAAVEIEKAVVLELRELNMRSNLKVEFEDIEPSVNGIDKIEIQISPNEGESLKPLKQIASGGELSRILLVLKKILREKSGVNVLVFDEIDTGISGGVARAVGLKLKALANQSQVICITHLAQVASLADKHIVVDKAVQGGRTQSIIKEVYGDERIDEVARMISGLKITDAARASARELLKI